MLVIEIAAGIVLAVVALAFWRVVLALGGAALAVATAYVLAFTMLPLGWEGAVNILAIGVAIAAFGFLVVQKSKAELARELAKQTPLAAADVLPTEREFGAATSHAGSWLLDSRIRGLRRR